MGVYELISKTYQRIQRGARVFFCGSGSKMSKSMEEIIKRMQPVDEETLLLPNSFAVKIHYIRTAGGDLDSGSEKCAQNG